MPDIFKKVKKMTAKKDVILKTGKRKSAVARASAVPGKGLIKINSKPLESIEPEMARLKIMEPIVLAGEVAKALDIKINVQGGGVMGQADAVRQAIAGILVEKDKKLRPIFLNYDKSMLVADPRRNEPHKPSRSKQGPRRHKQRSKR